MISWVFAGAAVLVVVAWVGYRRRLERVTQRELSDDTLRQIEARGRIEVEDPLDLSEAAEEEERFWSESWDEPEPM